MKVLFISSGSQPDYLCDCIYHGLKTLIGRDLESTGDLWYMYDTLIDEERKFLYGKGFTLYGLLNSKLKNVPGLVQVINNLEKQYYDYIIYGSIIKDDSLLTLVLKHYSSNQIAFIDGEDIEYINTQLVNKGLYFKREFRHKIKNVYPINFGIPAEKVLNSMPLKKRDWAVNYPGKLETYIHNSEHSYYSDYQDSKFAVTFKKEGWDCLRHYEIMANACLPYFKNIEECPENTLVNFPKSILKEIANKIDNKELINDSDYRLYGEQLLNFTKENLTTVSVAKSVIDTLDKFKHNDFGSEKLIEYNRVLWNLKIDKLLALTKQNTPGNRMLVYSGVSSIQTIRFLAGQYSSIYATDMFESAVASLKKALGAEEGKVIFIDNISQVTCCADTIILDMTLSYQENIVDYLIKVKSLMNLKSRLLLILPNFRNFATIIALIKNNLKFGKLQLSKHAPVNFYSKTAIERLLNSFGLKAGEVSAYDFDDTHLVKRMLNKKNSLSNWTSKMLIVEAFLDGE